MSKSKLTSLIVAKIMKALLKNFATSKKMVINNDIFLSNILGEGDGHAMSSSSASLFKSLTKWSIANNGGKNRRWPQDWINMRVRSLSNYLVEV